MSFTFIHEEDQSGWLPIDVKVCDNLRNAEVHVWCYLGEDDYRTAIRERVVRAEGLKIPVFVAIVWQRIGGAS